MQIAYPDFAKIDVRAGKIIDVQDFPEARRAAYKFSIDFGPEIGIKKSSAQVTKYYDKKDLLDKTIIAVVNFPPKQIGHFVSEVLILGLADNDDEIVLVFPDRDVTIGAKLC